MKTLGMLSTPIDKRPGPYTVVLGFSGGLQFVWGGSREYSGEDATRIVDELLSRDLEGLKVIQILNESKRSVWRSDENSRFWGRHAVMNCD